VDGRKYGRTDIFPPLILLGRLLEVDLIINWSQATVIDREPERFTRWIKEAVHIRKEGQQAMNHDEGSYQLSHAYDRFLDTASSRRVKNRKNWVPASSDEGLW